jgi:group I intron endonuclease
MIGIYKITSVKNKIYIGQSIDIEYRFYKYKRFDCKSQTKLYRSLKKYGVENHTFEVIEECIVESLNERERHWQDFYNAVSKENLNCLATSTLSKSGYMSNDSKRKMSISRTGVKRPIGFIERLRLINTGSKRSDESKKKMSIAQTGSKKSDETKRKMSISQKGRIVSDETKRRMKASNAVRKKVICLDTGIIYESLTVYCDLNNLVYQTTWGRLKKNKLNIKYYE